mgnify:CR=1 FL=1|tara:strand:+ start:246 stop:737 length:492 start_codon:yes stop_codon:yes gene_type:complete
MKKFLIPFFALLALPASVKAAYTSTVDLMTDETKIRISHNSTTKVSNSIGILEPATLWIRCDFKNDKTTNVEAFIKTPTYNADNNKVGIRWDSGEPIRTAWNESTSGTALFNPDPKKFINKLLESNTLVFQWSPYQSVPQAVKFDLIEMKKDIIQSKTEGCEF